MMNRHNLEFSLSFFKSIFFGKTLKQYFTEDYPYIFSESEIYNLLADELPKYNHQQLELHINRYMEHYFRNGEQLKKYFEPYGENKLDIYNVIFDFADTIITRFDNRFCFEYKYTDIWRRLTCEIDEEIFVIATVVTNDLRRQIDYSRKMDWPYCIEHNNREIKMMLQRDSGVSENHMHLRCSSPYFYLSWVYLMNNLENSQFSNEIQKMEKSKLKKYFNEENEYSLELIRNKAAAIRLYLYCYINKDKNKYYEEKLNSLIKLLENKIIPYEANNMCMFPINEVQKYIYYFKDFEGFDYAQNQMEENSLYYNLSGERRIIYNSFKIIYEKKEGHDKFKKFLFMYLLMKHRFRTEIVQSNNRVGFYNFAEYEGRKDFFIPWSEDVEVNMAKDAICSICDDMKFHRVELRISPKLTWDDNVEKIQMYDKAIKETLKIISAKHKMKCKRNFFYTLHFPKGEDTYLKGRCRHFELRELTYQRTRALIEFRSYAKYSIANRVLGIDACSHEIDCRPEVFGPAFRYLQDYEPSLSKFKRKSLRQIKSTYHVAEDNYDILDSLRAIYEAVYFLALRSGSRLGHATLLGMPVDKYYKHNNPICMPSQVFLDNIVWLYYFLSENNVVSEESTLLTAYLQKQFDIYFHKIFSDDLQTCFVNEIIKKARYSPYFDAPFNRKSYNKENCEFNIYHYYLSYLFRGDDPELYKNGFINKHCNYSDEYKICNTNSLMTKARNNFEANYLYYLYHYSNRVKERGKEPAEEVLPDYVIHAISLVQEKIKKLISERGIGIETNPTSNLFISIIDDYSEHPISNLYDHSLSKNRSDVQLNISINTDDKSTFSTCLSNEYAYLLYYLENKKDKDNNYMYSRFEIMQWLDEIRKMGNDQSFAN